MKQAVLAIAAMFGATGASAPHDYLIALQITDPRTAATPAAFPKMTVTAGTWGRVMAGKPSFTYDISVMPRPDADRAGSILLRWQIVLFGNGRPQTLKPVLSVKDGEVGALEVPRGDSGAGRPSALRIQVKAQALD